METNNQVGNWSAYYCLNATINYLPQVFLSFATLINLNKWIYFSWNVTTIQTLSVAEHEILEQNGNLGHRPCLTLKQKNLAKNVVTGFLILVMTVTYAVYMKRGCDGTFK
jgi:hypothetical protein